MSSKSIIPKTIKSLVYSKHSISDPGSVLKVFTYPYQKSDDILVRSLAFPINPSDINQLQGVYPSLPEKTKALGTEEPSAIAGNEGLFEVISLPNGVSNLSVGDWVIPVDANTGTWSTHRTFKSPSELIKVTGLDIYTAATVGVNGCTALQLVDNYAKWKGKNEWIVQNAGTSGVSKYVSQIAKARGIKTLSVIRDRDNFEEVASLLETKFGATKVISETENQDRGFSKTKLPLILGENPHIPLALNSVGGKSSSGIARKLSKNGLMLTYGGMSKQPVTLPTSLHIFKGIVSQGFWITENVKSHPELKVKSVKDFIKLYEDGHIVSPKDEIEPIKWDPHQFTDEQIFNLINNGIAGKGKKKLVILDW